MFTRLRAPLAASLVCFFILCSAGCSVPLAPGYRILKESREIRFVPGPPLELRIRAEFTLENYGQGELAFIDAVLPGEREFGRKNLRAQVDGRDAAIAELPEELRHSSPWTLRIQLDAPWQQKQKRKLALEYTLSSPEDRGRRITLGENDFHLGSSGWFPVLEPPRHVLAPFPARPDKTSVAIVVPSDFRLLSRGKPSGRKQSEGETEYRFLLRTADLAPYVVAGRYAESAAGAKSEGAVFWTLEPLKQDESSAAAQIAAAWKILKSDFGPLDKNPAVPHIVESTSLRAHFSGEEGPAASPFPGGALVNPAALSLGIGSEEFLQKVAHALAHDWFSGEVYPSEDSSIGIGEGLPEYATIVIDEARGGAAAREKRVAKLLSEYKAASALAAEKPVGFTRPDDPAEQRRIALVKAPLFYVALEDAYGEAAVRAGLARFVSLLRGREVGYDDLRAALEESTGKNLAAPFRAWIYETGIPKEFLLKFAGANQPAP
ncbi:MAG TPA: M1 family aminopeptidase [Candidatus Sulfotelmatobacter sp.]|nr:M1 family aminopeptidase [Candidatus Sulfotelmatobacter sp.]